MSGRPNDYAKIRNIIYGNDISDQSTTETTEEDVSPPETPAVEPDAEPEVVTDKAMHYGPSMYVKLFEEMLKTVLLGESHLFNEEERRFWATYARLTYASRYVLVKLALRAHKWHRMLGSARCIGNYAKDVGDGSSDAPIRAALEQLSGKRGLESYTWVVDDVSKDQWTTLLASERASADVMYPKESTKHLPKAENTPVRRHRFRKKRPSGPPPLASQIIDLTFDEDEDIKPTIQDLLPTPTTSPPAPEPEVEKSVNAALPSPPSSQGGSGQKGTHNVPASAHEAAIDTAALVESTPTLAELLGTLSGAELKQIARDYKVKAGGSTGELVAALLNQVGHKAPLADRPKMVQTTLLFTQGNPVTLASQADHLRQRVLQLTGTCVRLSDFAVSFFRRLNDVYYRNTMFTTTLMTPAILSSAKKRAYVAYDYRRTPNIWSCREDLMAFEEALKLEADLDALLDGHGIPPPKTKVNFKHPTPPKTSSPVKQSRTRTPSMTPKTEPDIHDSVQDCDALHDVIKPLTARQLAAQAALDLLGGALEQWRQLVKVKCEEAPRQGGLAPFEAGHVLTRVICKMVDALGRLKRHAEEDNLLIELLKQTRWRRGRRGGWWERRMTIATQAQYKNPAGWQRALDIAVAALSDPDTRLALRPKLERHLTRLEKALGIAEEDRHDSDGVLLEETKTSIQGTRVRARTASLSLDAHGRVIGDAPASTQKTLEHTLGYSPTQVPPDQDKASHTGKSVWVGRDGEHVNVETLVLQHYEDQGFKGVHSEGSAVRVLYGILFWDIIFAPIPGAFETPFQSAPLDLAEETFIYARQDLVAQRLRELEEVAGTARALVEKIDEEHRHKNTMCVGVRWNKWPKEDLVDIVECLGGPALAAICRMQAEDFAGTGGGVPDLLCWNTTTQHAKFIEVKGPGDNLSEKQRAWIDVMARAGIDIEVCKVIDPEAAADKEKKMKRRTESRTPKKRKAKSMPPVESEDEGDQLPAATQMAMGDDDDYFGAPDDGLEPTAATQRPSKRKRRDISPEL